MAAKKKLTPRLAPPDEEKLSPRQRELIDSIRSGPRGKVNLGGPFGIYLHAPDFGDLAQKLGAFCRYGTSVPPRLSEFAILVTARLWRAQYEWYVHAPIAEKAGVSARTISDLKAGRAPKSAPKDERAIHDFIKELYKNRRVSDRTYARVHAILGDTGMVEFAGILGYYALVAMTLDVFRIPIAEGAALPFSEPKSA
ncbi:MAG TPA: carboxymuconolactone decarboxylase family protein [Xanthobacteraceae bacterium]|jgi:4-carboxymuconolactone decarboxylase|nr:carboxymuconolactone decarboxylase family protein [Xanthobacteraceae bacterium]